MLEKTVVGVAVGVGAGALVGWWAWRRYNAIELPETWEEVGEVSDLTIYPLKSGRGISVKHAEATTHGLAHGSLQDRSFIVVQESDCRFITNRHVGKLSTVSLTVEGNTVTLQADGAEELKFDLRDPLKNPKVVHTRTYGNEAKGVDCGEEPAKWLTDFLYKGETRVRLLYKGNVSEDRPARRVDYYDFPRIRKTDRMYYADNCAYLITSEASLSDLNGRLDDHSVTMANFRANISVRGTRAFDEDDWAFVRIGRAVFRAIKPCQRCVSTVVDPGTGERNAEMEPLTSLRKYRLLSEPPRLAKEWKVKPIFGVNTGIDVTGPISVGDRVQVARISSNPRFSIL